MTYSKHSELSRCIRINTTLLCLGLLLPFSASMNGSFVRSGQSTTETDTSEKFLLNPSFSTEMKKIINNTVNLKSNT